MRRFIQDTASRQHARLLGGCRASQLTFSSQAAQEEVGHAALPERGDLILPLANIISDILFV